MTVRRLLIVALIAGSPAVAAAQFTTFIPPQTKAPDSVKTVVVAQQKAKADSIVNMKVADIKAWVDSAAGPATPMPASMATSAPASASDTTSTPRTVLRADSATMTNGQLAPATASVLPVIALAGAALAGLGLFLLLSDRKPRPARVRERA